jgi:acetylglutamate kinase
MKGMAVIKLGGATFGKHDTTIADIAALQQRGEPLVVVHGGGSAVTDWLKRQGVATKFVRGERVTDLPALEVATAVLAGLANKEITAAINVCGGRAVGISGADGALIEGRQKSREMGYVGEMVRLNTGLLETLLKAGFVPVISPISLYAVDRPEGAPALININGDPIAGDIAAAVKAARLIFLTDVPGIMDASGQLIAELSAAEAEKMINSGVIEGGMIPKVSACLRALEAGAVARIIDGRRRHALLNEFDGGDSGTTLHR